MFRTLALSKLTLMHQARTSASLPSIACSKLLNESSCNQSYPFKVAPGSNYNNCQPLHIATRNRRLAFPYFDGCAIKGGRPNSLHQPLHQHVQHYLSLYSTYRTRANTTISSFQNGREGETSSRVAVFWDLDNKQPDEVPPGEVADLLRQLAMNFGEEVDLLAYANRHAFSWVPSRVREERKLQRVQEAMERKGLITPDEPYRCPMCGAYLKTAAKLKTHFKNLHEREQKKKMAHVKQAKHSGQRRKLLDKYRERSHKFSQAAQLVLTPRTGYGLMGELRRAGVHVRLVSDAPQAADIALKKDLDAAVKSGQVALLCLVSDDGGYSEILRWAQGRGVKTVVVGNGFALKRAADLFVSWKDVLSGKAAMSAQFAADRWANLEGLAELTNSDADILNEDISWMKLQGLQRSANKASSFEELVDEDERPFFAKGWGPSRRSGRNEGWWTSSAGRNDIDENLIDSGDFLDEEIFNFECLEDDGVCNYNEQLSDKLGGDNLHSGKSGLIR